MHPRPAAPITVAMPQGLTVAIARQPILDAQLRVRAYELLHRGAAADGERATAQVLAGAFGDIGLQTIVGARPAFVNVSAQFLLDVDPLPFAPDAVVVELVDGGDPSPRLLARLRELTAGGYRLALDHFEAGRTAPGLLDLASFAKVDARGGAGAAERAAQALAGWDGARVATCVEDAATFDRCRALGFELFQGFFFCRPVLVSGRRIPTASLAALQDMAVLSRRDAKFEEIEAVISRDPGLSLRLMRLLNSAWFSLRHPVGSIRAAVTMIGAQTVRQWAMLLILGGVRVGCEELVPVALIRARVLGELAAMDGEDPDAAFCIGLFSVADALLGVPLDEALAGLPLTDEVAGALLSGDGPFGAALADLVALERDADAPVRDERLGELTTGACAWVQSRLPTLSGA